MIAILFLRLFMLVFLVWAFADVLYPIIFGKKVFAWTISVFSKKPKKAMTRNRRLRKFKRIPESPAQNRD